MDLDPSDRALLRARVPKKLRFPPGVVLVSMGEIARKWGISRNHAYTLVLSRYGMDRLNVSAKRKRKVYRVDVDDYYRATLSRIEHGIVENPDLPQPGLFGDCRQFDRK